MLCTCVLCTCACVRVRVCVCVCVCVRVVNKETTIAQILMAREEVQQCPELLSELRTMLESGYKAEIEALSWTSVAKGEETGDVQFFSLSYLPWKLSHSAWI